MKRLIGLLFYLSILSTVFAQNSKQKLSIQQCVKLALENNYEIKQVRLDESIASNKFEEVRSDLFPQVNAVVDMRNNFSLPVVMLPGELVGEPGKNVAAEFGTPYEIAAGVELNQVIFNPTLFIGIKIAKNARELADLKIRYTKEEIIYNVGVIYYDILYTEQQLESVNLNIKIQDSLYQQTNMKVAQEITREIDLNRIKVGITNFEVTRKRLNTVLNQQKRYLNILLGLPLDQSLLLDNSSFKELNFPISNKYDSSYLENKIELILLNKEKELTQLNMKSIKSQYLPNVSLFASGGYQFQSEKLQLTRSESWFDYSLIGLKVNIPIFDGGNKRKQIKQMDLNISKINEEILYTKQTIQMKLENAIQELENGYHSIKAQESNLSLAEKVYNQSCLLYREGLYNITDLLQTETAMHDAQVAYWSEIIKYKRAELDLMKAEGTLEKLIK